MIDTIFAISSGRPPAGIAVIRVSGPMAMAAATSLAGTLPSPRQATLRPLRNADRMLLDRALVIVFPGPRTATGEDVVELHCHGGRAVVAAVERALGETPGCRIAEPGEFTRRALMHGRIDLAEAEGLADLLEAETETQRIAALAAAEGRISRQITRWLDGIAILSARIEAVLDHADEDDVDAGDHEVARIIREMHDLAAEIGAVAAAPPVERLRDGIRVVIGGSPNAGKSTLLNLLAERDAAIVSPIAGTTRDRIEATVMRRGIAYILLDTAGLTETDDAVEAIGVERANQAIQSADILLWLDDIRPPRTDALWVYPRADLPERHGMPEGPTMAVRQDRSESIDRLWQEIEQRAVSLLPQADTLPLRERHRMLCRDAVAGMKTSTNDPLLIGEHLRCARVALAGIVGTDATEIMLDALFSRFCLGK
ncbi:tRNA uridine-5-carboxymethylaminomethyl(34) synthesis GTPase MnmE [Sphingomonas mollis]|uniref:tRNA modification GTPase MnmE n=1 Tax=Sphingomonas mollis TaxID=2795726 RepID=A0ABS0XQW7_9SPHN|nr:tRNA uridine-5-carboxymethylaminomethyl(34) synthesis GTPase MnmE [Sphingomonas sp. BT553]MBJ6122425.1 tRNA uridine-5-carboxymethylaminomethyl(34) synthesis GTPase MnmE [Sphingomonas sp. BT553]